VPPSGTLRTPGERPSGGCLGCAPTQGARVGELTQLRVQDIEHRGLWPCPAHQTRCRHGEDRQGPHSPRTSPFGRDGSAGLRRGGPVTPATAARPSRPVRGWLSGCGNSGSTDPGIQPNHAWRHTFKRRAARAGIEPRIRDGICGHAPRTVAEARHGKLDLVNRAKLHSGEQMIRWNFQ
jgi:integrase